MKASKVNIGDRVLASQYNNLVDDAKGGSFLLPHQQSSPDLTLKIEAGVCYVGATRVIYAGGNSPSFTAPTTNPRIDLLVIDNAGTLTRVAGTEAGSPVAPAYPSDKLVICEVYNRTSQTQIFDTDQGAGKGYIYNDVRPFLGGSYIANASQIADGIITQAKLAFSTADVPVGAVLAWLKSLTGAPALSAAFVECNGQTISDAGSPFNGVAIPNLNASGGGTKRFLRGSTSSGATGGEDTHQLTTAELAGHTHTVSGTPPSGGAVGWNGPTVGYLGGTTTASTGGDTAHENKPPYYEVVWIMRIK